MKEPAPVGVVGQIVRILVLGIVLGVVLFVVYILLAMVGI